MTQYIQNMFSITRPLAWHRIKDNILILVGQIYVKFIIVITLNIHGALQVVICFIIVPMVVPTCNEIYIY